MTYQLCCYGENTATWDALPFWVALQFSGHPPAWAGQNVADIQKSQMNVTVTPHVCIRMCDRVHQINIVGCADVSRYANVPQYKRCYYFPKSLLPCFTAWMLGQFS